MIPRTPISRKESAKGHLLTQKCTAHPLTIAEMARSICTALHRPLRVAARPLIAPDLCAGSASLKYNNFRLLVD